MTCKVCIGVHVVVTFFADKCQRCWGSSPSIFFISHFSLLDDDLQLEPRRRY